MASGILAYDKPADQTRWLLTVAAHTMPDEPTGWYSITTLAPIMARTAKRSWHDLAFSAALRTET